MDRVELRAAKIPSFPGIFADHYWLLVFHSGDDNHLQKCDRWEIWQEAHCNESCWGHLHKNLLAPYQGVGNGPSRLVQKWIDKEAVSIIEKIESSPETYPFINKYRYWPGPNSNTFAQWIVQGNATLCSRAIGRNFPVPAKIKPIQTKNSFPGDTFIRISRKLFCVKGVDLTLTNSAESLNTLGSESVFAGS